ncbi:class I SAM-dependent methyltransferase [Nicoliella spurrieriana]|uniref:Class I SAM-dependent methyltransferase n=1 Tax=Nicoliella spurrieriana TaxID=2925830 RepID=A0A976X561_9LACO|nr:class I SAM-dependent methyltransferase [Nicoliella spurrieriana]UQS86698.1 class I SAM-dependent methyltransferase [Nicoliella spurrieriana]
MIYGEFAELYDELFDPEMYANWVQFVLKHANGGSLLDLACGNGRLAIELAHRGFTPSGLDLSDAMLAIASQKASASNVSLPLYNGNMLDLAGLATFQTITCFDDSICYLHDQTELATLFKQVAAHLDNDGTFLFDVITPYQTDVIYPGYMYNYHDETRAFMWRSYAGEFEHSVEHDLAFFNYNPEKDAYDEFSELHLERTYPLQTYLRALNAAGFTKVTPSADFGTSEINPKTTRWFFVARRG